MVPARVLCKSRQSCGYRGFNTKAVHEPLPVFHKKRVQWLSVYYISIWK